jgi:hypothetical protein
MISQPFKLILMFAKKKVEGGIVLLTPIITWSAATAVSLYQGVEMKLEGIFPVNIMFRPRIEICCPFGAKTVLVLL